MFKRRDISNEILNLYLSWFDFSGGGFDQQDNSGNNVFMLCLAQHNYAAMF